MIGQATATAPITAPARAKHPVGVLGEQHRRRHAVGNGRHPVRRPPHRRAPPGQQRRAREKIHAASVGKPPADGIARAVYPYR